ncbi:MAG TPA: DUF2804 family protein [Solirubrobacteraceae bacterium]
MTGQSTPQSITAGLANGEAALPLADVPPADFRRSFRGLRPLKSWRYVGVFGEQLMACAAHVRVGTARQSFWALWTPASRMRERTRLVPRAGEVTLAPGLLRIQTRSVQLDLRLSEEAGIQARCPHGAHEVWTRKQAGVTASGTLSLAGDPPQPIEARTVIDDTAGYHARVTEWRWSAGVGLDPQGVPLAWNLVSGVNDPPHAGSERAVWIAGHPHEVGPVAFAADLSSIRGEGGSELHFQPLAERSRRENVLLVSSDYRAPFGEFSGRLPGNIELAHGLGVMEHHRARW